MLSRGIDTVNLLWSFLKPRKQNFILCIFLAFFSSIILGSALSLILPVVSLVFSSELFTSHENLGYFQQIIQAFQNTIADLEHKEIFAVGILFLMATFNEGIRFLVICVNSSLTAKITYDCRDRIYSVIQNMQYGHFSRHPHGMFIQLLITETRSVYTVFKHLLSIVVTSVNSFVLILLMMLLSWKLSLLLLACFPVIVLINLKIVKNIKLLGKKAINSRANLTSQVGEGILGLKQLRLLGAESQIATKVNKISFRLEQIVKSIQIRNSFQSFISQNLFILGVLGIFNVWFFLPVFAEGIPRKAGIVTFFILVSRLVEYLSSVAKDYGAIFANYPALKRVNEFLEKKHVMEQGGSIQRELLCHTGINLENIHFAFSADTPILKGISLQIKKGSYIGILGTSGSGKTTMFNLLPRIYDPTEGKILVDSVDIREFQLQYLRSKIGMISQDFFLFNSTIRENLLLSKPDAEENTIWTSLEKAGLYEFVKSQDQGLNSLVGNNGDQLSGGQRQRLSLAMLFLQNPEIIIMDEGTSSVDQKTEKHILNTLRELHEKGKTIICSTHKASTLSDADHVYEMRNNTLEKIR